MSKGKKKIGMINIEIKRRPKERERERKKVCQSCELTMK